MYSIDGLVHGIERCKINIATLQDAIKAEERTITEYKTMIATLERVDAEQEEAQSHVEIVRDDSN